MTGLGGRRRGERLAGVAVGMLLCVPLVACSADGDDDPADSGLPSKHETTAPTTEPSPTPTATEPSDPSASPAPSIPGAARKPGRAGAKAFVRFYVELENYARHTGDVAPLRTYSHPQCGGCNYFLRYYRGLYDRGGWIKGGDRTITTFDRVVPATAPHDMYVRISGRTESGTYRKRQGSSASTGHGERFTLLFWLVREPHGWRVSRLDTTS